MKRNFILASSSPRRKELLEQIGLKFKVVASTYQENMSLKMSHSKLVKLLAEGKAKDVAKSFTSGVIIGSDTFIAYQNVRLGKPKDKTDARNILRFISGKKLQVFSGLAIIDKYQNKKTSSCVITDVKIKNLTSLEISNYVKTKESLDKAGAFALQGRGAIFIEKINGCYSNVIGLPLNQLYKDLQKLKIQI